MGTLYQGHPLDNVADAAKQPEDLKVSVEHSTLVFPMRETERKSMFLSNIDQVLNFDVQTVHFFGAHPDYPPEVVKEKLKNGLSKVLVAYDFLAGRLKLHKELERLEIDCNGAGAGFVIANSDLSLDEIGDLVYPNPAFTQLIVSTLDNLPDHDQPLCILQVTSFRCGGFAMGISSNHATFDGISFKTFIENLASQIGNVGEEDKPLPIPPCNDRYLLAARSPPRVTFPHPELQKIPLLQGSPEDPAPVFECRPEEEELDFQIFRLSSNNLVRLKQSARMSATTTNGVKISGFNAVTAHIWRCKALSRARPTSSNDVSDDDDYSTVLYAVDIRARLQPPLPKSYTGNAVLSAYATAKLKELEEGPFYKLVEMVREGAERMTDEYVRSAIDWGEVYKGFPHGEFMISSWLRLGFADVEYPWGKPRYSCPVVYHRKDIILLFPDIINGDDGFSTTNNGTTDGVNVLVALPHNEMKKFQTLFYKFLP